MKDSIPNPDIKLKTNRSLLKYFFLGAITLRIYDIVVMAHISKEINCIASPYDHRHTISYILVLFIFSWLTAGIYPLIWSTNFCDRIGDELSRRRIDYKFGAGTFWLWCILGTCIVIGPFVYIHKLMKSMNKLAEDYNTKGC